MNPQKAVIAILMMLCASLAVADDFETYDGKEYKNATVRRVEMDGIVVSTKGALSKLYFTELPKDVQEGFHSFVSLQHSNQQQSVLPPAVTKLCFVRPDARA